MNLIVITDISLYVLYKYNFSLCSWRMQHSCHNACNFRSQPLACFGELVKTNVGNLSVFISCSTFPVEYLKFGIASFLVRSSFFYGLPRLHMEYQWTNLIGSLKRSFQRLYCSKSPLSTKRNQVTINS